MNPTMLIPIAEAVAKTTVKLLVYGLSGAGKTTLLASLPGPGLVLSAESGLLSLRRLVKLFHAGTQVLGVPEGQAGVDALRFALAEIQRNPGKYAWVALDSISEIAETVLSSEKAKTKDPRQAYGALADEMGKLLRAFRDLPDIDVYFSAKAGRQRDEATGKITLEIMMPGTKVGQNIPYLFDEVLFLKKTDDGTRVLQTDGDNQVIAKDRSGVLDKVEPVDSTEGSDLWGLGKIIDKIKRAE